MGQAMATHPLKDNNIYNHPGPIGGVEVYNHSGSHGSPADTYFPNLNTNPGLRPHPGPGRGILVTYPYMIFTLATFEVI